MSEEERLLAVEKALQEGNRELAMHLASGDRLHPHSAHHTFESQEARRERLGMPQLSPQQQREIAAGPPHLRPQPTTPQPQPPASHYPHVERPREMFTPSWAATQGTSPDADRMAGWEPPSHSPASTIPAGQPQSAASQPPPSAPPRGSGCGQADR